MVWGAVGGGKLGDIVVVPDEDDCDDGGRKKGPKRQKRVNQDVYIDILNKNLCRSLRKTGCSIFMQDGAPCHTAKKVQQWFDDHPWVTLLPWAPQSPDMNIIENLWTLLKQEVAKLPAATNREELKERILSAWKNLGRRRDALKNLCDSMPRRVSALVQSRGGPTKY